ncbi:transposase [Bradyrhizobium sp. GM22.5]
MRATIIAAIITSPRHRLAILIVARFPSRLSRYSRVRSEAERARIVAESLLPGAQVSEVARKHGATRWQIYDWRRRFRQRGMLSPREVSQPTFAPLVVEGALEERQVPAIKLEIAIGDVVLRTDTAIDGEQLSRVIRAMRASR